MPAIGDIASFGNAKKSICLLTAAVATNSPPAAATAGVPNYPVMNSFSNAATGACYMSKSAASSTLMVNSSAGSGVMTATLRLWGYHTTAAAWYPINVNNGNALAEITADAIRYAERFPDLGHYDRLYLEIVAIGGTSTAIEAWLVTAMEN